ncbi:hypothetical protein VD0004_g6553 [Verticillium dahliae]|uniref:SMODS and SLOG-associating 2TM effector domain-containing protein n=3 Tax=Verticillium TaxID=1036719 RepID=G2WQE2_VERDV|nr:uncharacterized protein VDAG_00584 [Verticillium dahliae VdLs.17]KAF3350692.1 hypothetical protein VdG2_01156 [Verticillium dahliae VDG2]KAH6710372.1 hypothetical protein EV126DRAFT_476384 [Verticillium dahliae]EGY13902.1 hypothetical protein VDAG_00584 [Verticillium dahliae VdLs.17]PNH33395.1 hypothetical protein BJF96_g3396 [Verticillium dahliae]PNH40423.1 hypothetical protein VD0004_g6553 [Verticillium dahliae]
MSDNAPLPRPDPLPNPSSSTPSLLSKPQRKHVRYRFLTPSERAIFARAVGADMDLEDQTPLYPPTSMSWFKPRRRLPSGLYKDVAALRRKYLFYFHAVAFLRWAGMMMQLFVGAALTGVGAMAFQSGIPITILAGVNTVIAGMLAMLHNSGLPDRYRINQAEFEGVEDLIKAVLNTGIVKDTQTVDQAIMECFETYRYTRAVVAANDPSFYTSMAVRRAGNTEAARDSMVVARPRPRASS